MAEPAKCQGLTKQGKKCSKPPQKGCEYCWQHVRHFVVPERGQQHEKSSGQQKKEIKPPLKPIGKFPPEIYGLLSNYVNYSKENADTLDELLSELLQSLFDKKSLVDEPIKSYNKVFEKHKLKTRIIWNSEDNSPDIDFHGEDIVTENTLKDFLKAIIDSRVTSFYGYFNRILSENNIKFRILLIVEDERTAVPVLSEKGNDKKVILDDIPPKLESTYYL